MNIRLESRREKDSGAKLILAVALAAAVLIGAGVFAWVRLSRTQAGPPRVEGLLHKGDAEYEKYISLLSVAAKKATVQRNYAGQRTVLVSGTIHNGTERWMEALEIRIILFHGDQPALQDTRLPLFPGSHAKPAPPEGDFSFAIMLDKVPSDWTGGSFDVEIAGFKLGR
ncbi:MAG TPA: hypothetical protein VGQ81_08610 [Acidobacteriota bacterium]|jgi:hypothetical protein|nr:hypothetical protein [Acidobacteriota bacterium]